MEIVTICKQLESVARSLEKQPQNTKLIAEAGFLITELRKLNRSFYSHLKQEKQKSVQIKTQVESSTLELSNLLYEKEHMSKALRDFNAAENACETIELLPIEEFLERAPEKMSEDPHQLLLNRLEHEVEERKRLIEERKALETQGHKFYKDNRRKRQNLDFLNQKLDAFIKASSSLQKEVAVELEPLQPDALLCELSKPLFKLYQHIYAYQHRNEGIVCRIEKFQENDAMEVDGIVSGEVCVVVETNHADYIAGSVCFRFVERLQVVTVSSKEFNVSEMFADELIQPLPEILCKFDASEDGYALLCVQNFCDIHGPFSQETSTITHFNFFVDRLLNKG